MQTSWIQTQGLRTNNFSSNGNEPKLRNFRLKSLRPLEGTNNDSELAEKGHLEDKACTLKELVKDIIVYGLQVGCNGVKTM